MEDEKEVVSKLHRSSCCNEDADGNLITSQVEIEDLSIETYKKRLENQQIHPNLETLKREKEILCDQKSKAARSNKSEPWTLRDLEVVLKSLKKNKSRDPLGLANELFCSEVAGKDLKLAILKLMNRIKSEGVYPEKMKLCNISSIWKRKGSRDTFDNY